MTDNHSVSSNGSTSSISNQKIECPCCNEELQSRGMFIHIRSKHPGYFQTQTTKEWLNDAAKGKPLKFFWESKINKEEIITLYGCLATGKTFQTEAKALAHFKKYTKELREHNKQIMTLSELRDIQLKKAREQKLTTPPTRNEWKILRETNDPELIDAMKDICLNHYLVCERLCSDAATMLDQSYTTKSPDVPKQYQEMTIAQVRELLVKVKTIIDTDPKLYKTWSNILLHLQRILLIRKYFNGITAPELEYPYFQSLDHPNGRLSTGDSRFVIDVYNEGRMGGYIWPLGLFHPLQCF